MRNPFRILLIDENSEDRHRTCRELSRAFPDSHILEIINAEQLEKACAAQNFDLVVTEYHLSWSDGLSILRRVKSLQPHTPVIIFTKTGNEEIAVQGMKLGLDDYVLKSSAHFSLLTHAVETANERSKQIQEAGESRFPSLFESVPIGLYRISLQGEIIRANSAFINILGYPDRGSLLNEVLAEKYFHIEDRKRWQEQLRKVGECHDFEAPMRRHDGEVIWVWNSISGVRGENDHVLYYEGSLKDITDQVRIDEALRNYANRLSILRAIDQSILGSQSPEAIAKTTLQQIQQLIPSKRGSVAIFELDEKRVTVFATSGTRRTRFGTGTLLSPDTFGDIQMLQRGETVVVDDTHDITDASPQVQSLQSEGIRSYLKIPLLDQGTLIGSLNLETDKPASFTKEHVQAAQEVADSLSIAIQQALLSEQVHRLAITDELTGLFNRRHFFELAQREFERALRYQRPLTAIMLDIDHFKRVNDTFGHATGDQVLRAVARRCKFTIRDFDILGRYGGEEFAILLPETNLSAGQMVAERLRKEVATAPIDTDREALRITISLGVAKASNETSNLSVLLDHADTAMYAAKQSGRNRVMVV